MRPLKSMLLCDILRESQTYNRKLVLVVTRLTESTTCISGVYLTSLGPENSTEKLVGNNWDDLMPSPALVKDKEARTEWVVEVPQGRAQRVGRNRDVYLHRGDLKLDGNCRIYRRSKPDEYCWCTLLWAWPSNAFLEVDNQNDRSWSYELWIGCCNAQLDDKIVSLHIII